MADSQQHSLLRLIQAGVSVYCPHTSLDAASGGMNDWLASFATADPKIENEKIDASKWKSIAPATPSKAKEPGHETAGMGRVVELNEPQTVDEVAARLKRVLGDSGKKPLGNVGA
jgi:putative NIF3 family GTP cyclohydrolase 1 type 2